MEVKSGKIHYSIRVIPNRVYRTYNKCLPYMETYHIWIYKLNLAQIRRCPNSEIHDTK